MIAQTSHIAVQLPIEEIADFCRRNHIRKISLFGSALHVSFNAGSDIDLLDEFEPWHTPGHLVRYGNGRCTVSRGNRHQNFAGTLTVIPRPTMEAENASAEIGGACCEPDCC